MNKLLMYGVAAAALVVAPHADAANTAIIMWNSADPGGAESATGTGSAALATQDLSGITITLSNVTRGTAPNTLTEGNINVDNTTGSVQTLDIIAGANGYAGPSTDFKLTGTVGVTSGMADFTGDFFADSANTLNGTSVGPVVGASLNTFDTGSLTGPFSISENLHGVDAVAGPYGMAERLTLTLQPGAQVFVDGASMQAAIIPEPRTWAMLLMGFGLMAFFGFKRSRKERLLTI